MSDADRLIALCDEIIEGAPQHLDGVISLQRLLPLPEERDFQSAPHLLVDSERAHHLERCSDIRIDERITLTSKMKEGDYVGRKCAPAAILDVPQGGMLPTMNAPQPRGQASGGATSHAFVKNLKRYAREASVGVVHLHQTRHSFVRIVAEEAGLISDTQDALGTATPTLPACTFSASPSSRTSTAATSPDV
jgi:hypothetical protein